MAGAAHGDPALLLTRESERTHDVSLARRPHDQVRTTIGHQDIPADASHWLV